MITPDMTNEEMWIEWACLTVDLLNAGGNIEEVCNQLLEEKGNNERMRKIVETAKLIALYWEAGIIKTREQIHAKLQEKTDQYGQPIP